MHVSLSDFQRQSEEHSQVTKEANYLAILANETLQKATLEFNETIEIMKKTHKDELANRDRAIKWLVIGILAVSSCTLYLGIRIITNKC